MGDLCSITGASHERSSACDARHLGNEFAEARQAFFVHGGAGDAAGVLGKLPRMPKAAPGFKPPRLVLGAAMIFALSSTAMAASFDAFIPGLLKHEGGFVSDPSDPGGATNKGITLKTYQTHAQSFLSPPTPPTLDDFKKLTDREAGAFHKRLYWDPLRGDEIALQELANIVVDFQVNHGAVASRTLQQTLNDLGAKPPLPVDGAIGPAVIAALNAVDQKAVYRRYKKARIQYCNDLVARRPALSKFLKGWLKRVDSFPDL